MMKDASTDKAWKAAIKTIENTMNNNRGFKPSDYEQLNIKVLVPIGKQKKEQLGTETYDKFCSRALTELFQVSNDQEVQATPPTQPPVLTP